MYKGDYVMAQYLALPLNNCTVTCCYKKEAPNYYLLRAGSVHYGVDFIGYSSTKNEREFFASGNGVVLGIGTNSKETVGKWVAVKYTNVCGYGDLIVRYFHLEKITVAKGQAVNIHTKIGRYGDTGPYVKPGSYHLHVEVDTDVQYWNYTPTIASASGGLRAGTRDTTKSSDRTTRNPLDVLRRKISDPEKQSCTIQYNANYCKRIALPLTFQ